MPFSEFTFITKLMFHKKKKNFASKDKYMNNVKENLSNHPSQAKLVSYFAFNHIQ